MQWSEPEADRDGGGGSRCQDPIPGLSLITWPRLYRYLNWRV